MATIALNDPTFKPPSSIFDWRIYNAEVSKALYRVGSCRDRLGRPLHIRCALALFRYLFATRDRFTCPHCLRSLSGQPTILVHVATPDSNCQSTSKRNTI